VRTPVEGPRPMGGGDSFWLGDEKLWLGDRVCDPEMPPPEPRLLPITVRGDPGR